MPVSLSRPSTRLIDHLIGCISIQILHSIVLFQSKWVYEMILAAPSLLHTSYRLLLHFASRS